MSQTQILYIHGGMTFKSQKDYLKYLRTRDVSLEKKESWSGRWFEKKLGKEFQIVSPRMPLSENAKYSEWKIYFERFLPKLGKNVILMGNSLGGIFLAKYLSENKLPRKVISTYLVCPPFDNKITGEDLTGGFKLKSDLSLLEKNSKNLYLLFSKNDPVVPPSQAKKYAAKLKDATIIVYDHIEGHFQVSEFPEIVKMLKNDVKNK